MNLYRVEIAATDDKGNRVNLVEDVKAGDMQVESACLIFRKSKVHNDVIMTYKSWDKAYRVAVNV